MSFLSLVKHKVYASRTDLPYENETLKHLPRNGVKPLPLGMEI